MVSRDHGKLRLAVAPDGALAAVVCGDHIEVFALPALGLLAEIDVESDADHDIALVAKPSRLVVVTRREGSAIMHVIDPLHPRKVGEVRLPEAMHVAASSGTMVLVTGATTTAIVDLSRHELAATSLPTRTAITAAAPFEHGRFIVSTHGVIEEWDVQVRAPTRRFRLPRPVFARHIGGSAQSLWLIPQSPADRIELVPLTAVGRSQTIELPEPVARVASHPAGDLLVVVGAVTGTAFVVDGAKGTVVALDVGPVDDAAWCGATAAVVVVGADRPIELIAAAGPLRTVATPAIEFDDDASVVARPAVVASRAAAAPPVAAAPPGETAAVDSSDTAGRLAAWRARVGSVGAHQGASAAAAPPGPAASRGGASAWRDTLVIWTRSVLSGKDAEPPTQQAGLLLDVVDRLDLDGDPARGLALAYGAHLCGLDGLAAVDLARVMGGRWDEALGGGRLAATGALRWRHSRVRLSPAIAAALDQLPPLTGVVIGDGAAVGGAAAIVAPPDVAMVEIAAWAAPMVGALLVPTPDGARHPQRFFLEARIRAVTPLVPWAGLGPASGPPAITLVANAATATQLALPVVASWPAG